VGGRREKSDQDHVLERSHAQAATRAPLFASRIVRARRAPILKSPDNHKEL
jgi:hypothetical protein